MAIIQDEGLVESYQKKVNLLAEGVTNLPIQPVVNSVITLNPPVFIKSTTHTGSGSATLMTAQSPFYMTYAFLSYNKDNLADTTQYTLSVTSNGQTQSIISLWPNAATAEQDHCVITFPFPIKCDAGTTVTFGGGTKTAGTHNIRCCVMGYYQKGG